MLSSCCDGMATVSYAPFSLDVILSCDLIAMDVTIANYLIFLCLLDEVMVMLVCHVTTPSKFLLILVVNDFAGPCLVTRSPVAYQSSLATYLV
jgi:hypothetical protein